MPDVEEDRYKLSCSLTGHENDVRGICSVPSDSSGLVTVSRDCTGIVWKHLQSGNQYVRSQLLSGHSNFVTCVAVVPPGVDITFPDGVIYTGSHDCTILAYRLDGESSPAGVLRGHEKTVCSLSAEPSKGILVSGSWDHTARVWVNGNCENVLKGHESSVWATLTLNDGKTIITGSADKTIKFWNIRDGLKRTLKGHEDIVRALSQTPLGFLSASNDGVVIHWTLDGVRINTLKAHDTFIFSISVRSDGEEWATCAEEGTLKVWNQEGNCTQTIDIPTQTPWAITYLTNNDMAVACSDGVCRVFTKSPGRMASKDELEAYAKALELKNTPPVGGGGDEAIDINQLAGTEALRNPGNKDGQHKIIREGNMVVLYQWHAIDGEWRKVGDVTSSKNNQASQQGKTTFEGAEYDYVFSVDIEDDKPPLKLPYNKTENPWEAAQKFIHKHNLSQYYLEQIANFIVKNSQSANAALPPIQSAYQDPFTGSSRYVANQPSSTVKEEPSTSPSFTCSTYLQHSSGNATKIVTKLVEINNSQSLPFQEDTIRALEKAVQPDTCSRDVCASLKNLLSTWPVEHSFPLLDVLRLALCHKKFKEFVKEDSNPDWLIRVLEHAATNPAGNAVVAAMAYRGVNNMFTNGADNQRLAVTAESLLNGFAGRFAKLNHHLEGAVAGCSLNYAVYLCTKVNPDEEIELRMITHLECVRNLLGVFTNSDALKWLCLAIGTIVHKNEAILVIALQQELPSLLKSKCLTASSDSSVKMMAQPLLKFLEKQKADLLG